jgi:uncharacterized protein (TIGR03435 family)
MIRDFAKTTLIAFAVLAAAGARTTQAQPAFEAASVKPSPPPVPGRGAAPVVRGGPGSSDPGLATFENVDLFSLVTMAYGVKRYQLSAPDWLSSARFNISARVPPGATTEQYRLMLQGLLAERFKLAVHRERKELQVYELVVGKNGSKIKESPKEPAVDPAVPVNDGLQPPPPRAGPPPGYHGPVNMTLTKLSMERFAALLSGLLDQPVEDHTGLNGNYDGQLHALVGSNPPDIDAANSPPGILDAVQEQLGLRLVPNKGLVDVLVIDHMEKTPSEN